MEPKYCLNQDKHSLDSTLIFHSQSAMDLFYFSYVLILAHFPARCSAGKLQGIRARSFQVSYGIWTGCSLCSTRKGQFQAGGCRKKDSFLKQLQSICPYGKIMPVMVIVVVVTIIIMIMIIIVSSMAEAWRTGAALTAPVIVPNS